MKRLGERTERINRREKQLLKGTVCLILIFFGLFRVTADESAPSKVALSEITPFTLPDGSTQLSWTTNVPTDAPAVVRYGTVGNLSSSMMESESGLRNHRVILTGLPKGENVTAEVSLSEDSTDDGGKKTVTFQAGFLPVPGPSRTQVIPLTVSEPTPTGRLNWPVTSGVPFEMGALAGADDLYLTDASGTILPAQFETIYRWPDGSVKWLTCQFRADTDPKKPSVYYLKTESALSEKRVGGLKNGSAVASSSSPSAESERERVSEILEKITSRVTLADGTVYECRPNSFKTVKAGPFDLEVHAFGHYVNSAVTPDNVTENAEDFRWRCEATLFGEDFIRIRWTLGNHRLIDPMTLVRSAELSFENPSDAPLVFSDGSKAEKTATVSQLFEKTATISLDDAKTETEHFDGFVRSGERAWFFRDFWETWPKGLRCEEGRVTFNILPALGDGYSPKNGDSPDELFLHYYWLKDNAFQFKRGMEIRHDIWLSLKDRKESPDELAAHFRAPLFAVCDPAYYCATGTFPPCQSVNDHDFPAAEKAMAESFAHIQEGQRKRGEYGWMNYGDWFGENRYNWGNNEYDGIYFTLLQFIRTGNPEWLNWGIRSARHYSTVDFIAYPWKNNTSERMYLHCTGHVNWFFDEEDPRLQTEEVKKQSLYSFKFEADTSGGHAFHPGNFYATALTGDRRFLDVAETACLAQAQRYTRDFHFGIERSAGWVLTNATYAYFFTGNPYFRNAADIYFEEIKSAQNPETGGFDLPQDQSECDCPDKAQHRGGKAFAVGVLMHGLIRYYKMTGNTQARDAVVRCSDWLLNQSWNESKKLFRYKTGCPKYENDGYYCLIVVEGIAFAGDVTGDSRYLDFLTRTLGPVLKSRTFGESRGEMKDFTQDYRQIPQTLYYLQKYGVHDFSSADGK